MTQWYDLIIVFGHLRNKYPPIRLLHNGNNMTNKQKEECWIRIPAQLWWASVVLEVTSTIWVFRSVMKNGVKPYWSCSSSQDVVRFHCRAASGECHNPGITPQSSSAFHALAPDPLLPSSPPSGTLWGTQSCAYHRSPQGVLFLASRSSRPRSAFSLSSGRPSIGQRKMGRWFPETHL